MMVSFSIPAEIVDEDGETTWVEVKIQPSDDPADDWLDFSIVGDDAILPASGNLMFRDPDELMHALELARAERGKLMAEVEQEEAHA